MEDNVPETKRTKKKKDNFFIREFLQNLYNNNLTRIYDPITEDIYNKNQERDLINNNFYYFNMHKDQEDYVRDIQLKEQEKMANRNNQIVSSTSIRNFRKNQGDFTIFNANSEFNKYPNLEHYKTNFDPEIDINL